MRSGSKLTPCSECGKPRRCAYPGRCDACYKKAANTGKNTGNAAWKELGEHRKAEALPKFTLTPEDVFARRQGSYTND